MQGYELAFIVNPDLVEDTREKLVESVKSLVEKSKGEPGELEVWGKRDFTFPIHKKTSGVYYLLYFTCEPITVSELDKKLKLEGNIVRFLIVKRMKRKVKALRQKPIRQGHSAEFSRSPQGLQPSNQA